MSAMIKSKDLSLVIVVAVVAAVISFVTANAFFKTSKVKTKAEVVEAISADFPAPDKAYFNEHSINPTQIITIGEGNPTPFKDAPKQ